LDSHTWATNAHILESDYRRKKGKKTNWDPNANLPQKYFYYRLHLSNIEKNKGGEEARAGDLLLKTGKITQSGLSEKKPIDVQRSGF